MVTMVTIATRGTTERVTMATFKHTLLVTMETCSVQTCMHGRRLTFEKLLFQDIQVLHSITITGRKIVADQLST